VKSDIGVGSAVSQSASAGRHLHRLDPGHVLSLGVADHHDGERGGEAVDGADAERAPERLAGLVVPAPYQVPGADPEDEEGGGGHRRRDDVRELDQHVRVGDDLSEALHLGSAVAQRMAHRLLHERVGHQDPVGREVRVDRHQPDRGQVGPLGQLVPTEDPQPQEGGLEEEGDEPSIASGAPKTSPTKREYSDQFIPNWNSWTMPVTTPIAKLTRKSFPQNLVRRFQTRSPVRCQAVCSPATTQTKPSVSGTKKKW
jgi:hypothetical protein